MNGFGGFVVRRAAGAVVTLFALSVIIYVVFYVTPGDVAEVPAAQREMLAQQVAQFAGANDVQALVSALRAEMEIEVVEENL